jgi:magnesium-protoporphyrin IX monomethyl ester (oxidative) cyclase
LGLELVAEAARRAGHDVKLIDLQVDNHRRYLKLLDDWSPHVVAFSCNYLANVPEIIDLARLTKERSRDCFVFVGGHSATFTAREILEHSAGNIDCVLKGEGEASVVTLLSAIEHDRGALDQVPGAVSSSAEGPTPRFVEDLNDLRPARDLVRARSKYFIGMLDPCASVEFSRGCPWDCTFCSAWTFYGRSYRTVHPEVAAEEVARIREPGVFIVDDVAFIQSKHGMAIGEEIARRGIKKQYYLETRGDVLLRNKEVFKFWRGLGVGYIFLGLEAIDEEGLRKYRKRVPLGRNFEALEFARSLGVKVAINLIADPDWDEQRFKAVRDWCLEIPEIVNISVNTPYPGTEIWTTESRNLTTRDYRLFDIQHSVLPTKLPLADFYKELVKTQQVMNMKHLGWSALREYSVHTLKLLLKGQTNFFKMLWKFNSVYNPDRLLADHEMPVRYRMSPPPQRAATDPRLLYVHGAKGRRGRAIDDETERFVEETRMGAGIDAGETARSRVGEDSTENVD